MLKHWYHIHFLSQTNELLSYNPMSMVEVLPFAINFTHHVWEESCVDCLSEYTYILKLILLFKIGTMFVKPDKKLSLSMSLISLSIFALTFCPKKNSQQYPFYLTQLRVPHGISACPSESELSQRLLHSLQQHNQGPEGKGMRKRKVKRWWQEGHSGWCPSSVSFIQGFTTFYSMSKTNLRRCLFLACLWNPPQSFPFSACKTDSRVPEDPGK